MTKRFNIAIEGDYDFEPSELWPDGDGPADPTVDDVIAMILRDLGDRPSKIAHELGIQMRLLVDGKEIALE